MDDLRKYKFEFDKNGFFQFCFIPKEIGKCPNCGKHLTATAEEWETETKKPTTIKVDCVRNLECFIENKQSQFNRMPYVYWLPLETAATKWVLEQLCKS